MAAVNSPVFPSIPLDIQKELVNPFTPWEVSQELFGQLQLPAPGAQYRKAQILPDKAEWRFIWRYFHHLKPLRYTIKRVYFIFERHQQQSFVSAFSAIEREATTFPPSWDQESRADQRAQAIQRWKETAQIFSPFTTQEGDGRSRSWTHTKILPLWHGTNGAVCDSICTSGFVYFGKKNIPGADGNAPKSTDDGYFGSGIYFTNSARYAADIYSKGHLLMGWVSMREPFPVVGDPNQTDMATLRGLSAYKNYNAHYVPVAPIDPNDPYCAEYHPVQANQAPTCDEYVVFQKSQALPQYWIELEVDFPYVAVPGQLPQFVNELIPHLMRILQNSQIDRDPKLRNLLNKQLALLLKLSPDDDLSQEQANLYEQITHLLTPQGTINKALRNQMVNAALPDPAPVVPEKKVPLQTAKAPLVQEEKEQPPARVGKQQKSLPRQAPVVTRPNRPPITPSDRAAGIAHIKKMIRALGDVSNQNIFDSAGVRFELADDREFLFAALKEGYHLKYVSEELKQDREFMFTVVQRHGSMLQYASEQLKNDRAFVLTAVQKTGWILKFASERLKGDRAIVLAAVQECGYALKDASEQLKGDRVIVLAAVQQTGLALEHASKQLKGDREIVLTAVQKNGSALKCASEQLKGDSMIIVAAVHNDYSALGYASEQLRGDRVFMSKIVQQNQALLGYVSKRLRGDRAFVLAAVQQYGSALRYASEPLKGDREIVLAAVQQDGMALEYASELLKDDKKLVRAAIQENNKALQYASKRVQAKLNGSGNCLIM